MIPSPETIESAKRTCDWICGGVTVATVVGALPHIAAAVTVVYTIARFMETAIFKKVLRIVCAKCAAWWES